MKIISWNVNGIRAVHKKGLFVSFVEKYKPDILCLQETKVIDEEFPLAAFENTGYIATYCGQKSYNGVATLARVASTECVAELAGAPDVQKRFLAVTVNGVRVVNVYIPNGESVESVKYAYKLEWLKALTGFLTQELKRYPRLVLLGDFNIAPEEQDVHNPKRWEGDVLFSEPERAAFRELIAGGLVDVFRRFEQPEKSFTWWDYRLNGFARNWGLRIDHILCSPLLASECRGCHIDVEPRRAERPSDHVPVTAEFNIAQS